MALMAGAGELVGGVLFGLGLITPLGAALITGVMVTAVWTVHRVNGLWVSDGGFEYNLVLVAVVFAVTVAGPGSWSLDHAWNIDLSGYAWAMIEIGAGVLGGVAAWVLGRLTGRRHRRRGGEGAVATGV
jgi:putative oxidoreductase